MVLLKEDLCKVIEGRGEAARIPMMHHFWIFPDVYGERKQEVRVILDRYPCDVDRIYLTMPDVFNAPKDDPGYRLVQKDPPSAHAGLDASPGIGDWAELAGVLAHFPSPEYPKLVQSVEKTGRYRLAYWYSFLFELLWKLRGMENALTDFYFYPDEVHKVFGKLTDFFCRAIERAKHEADADGVFFCDDIGTQKGPFFSLDMFNEFIKPYYKRIFDCIHSLGMHVWLHTCGNIELFLPGLIEIGVDVIHPIQKYTMDERRIANLYGDKICILAGFDVQQILPFGTPDDVRAEARFLSDTYRRSDGRLILTLGNGSTPDWPIANIEALLDESVRL